MWQIKYAAAIPKNLGLGLNFRPCSEGFSISGRPQSVGVRLQNTQKNADVFYGRSRKGFFFLHFQTFLKSLLRHCLQDLYLTKKSGTFTKSFNCGQVERFSFFLSNKDYANTVLKMNGLQFFCNVIRSRCELYSKDHKN